MPNLLRLGDNGPDVRKLQNFLNRCLPVPIRTLKEDGIFGPLTLARVKEFQVQAGLVPDGMVGPQTEETLILSANRFSTIEQETLAFEWDTKRSIEILKNQIV